MINSYMDDLKLSFDVLSRGMRLKNSGGAKIINENWYFGIDIIWSFHRKVNLCTICLLSHEPWLY